MRGTGLARGGLICPPPCPPFSKQKPLQHFPSFFECPEVFGWYLNPIATHDLCSLVFFYQPTHWARLGHFLSDRTNIHVPHFRYFNLSNSRRPKQLKMAWISQRYDGRPKGASSRRGLHYGICGLSGILQRPDLARKHQKSFAAHATGLSLCLDHPRERPTNWSEEVSAPRNRGTVNTSHTLYFKCVNILKEVVSWRMKKINSDVFFGRTT